MDGALVTNLVAAQVDEPRLLACALNGARERERRRGAEARRAKLQPVVAQRIRQRSTKALPSEIRLAESEVAATRSKNLVDGR